MQVMQMLVNEEIKTAVSHIIIDPGTFGTKFRIWTDD